MESLHLVQFQFIEKEIFNLHKVFNLITKGPVICYYVGKKNGLIPKDSYEDSTCFSIILACEDLRMSFFKFYFCKNEEEKKQLFLNYENYLKQWLQNMDKLIKDDGHFFEERTTAADLCVFDVINNIILPSQTSAQIPVKLSLLHNNLLNDKKLSKLIKPIENSSKPELIYFNAQGIIKILI
jgi:hypothetical protein